MRNISLLSLTAIALSSVPPTHLLAGSVTQSEATPAIVKNYIQLPLAFERHSKDSDERFVARGAGYAIGLDRGKAVLAIATPRGESFHTVSLEFTGSRAAKAESELELPGKVNYIHGNDRRNWQIGLSTWQRVRYPDVYPGIDVVYYGNQQQLEFDLVLKAGADPRSIRMKISGGSRLSLDGSGALRIETGGGADLRLELPHIYQQVDGRNKDVTGRYQILGHDEIAFSVDSWDRMRPLVIDPTIVYSTLLGGEPNNSAGYGIAVDSSGNILLTGYTDASDFPVVDAAQNRLRGHGSGFVAKINAAGTALTYSTYLGGSSYDYLLGLAVDSAGSAWVTGYSMSSDFPVLNAAQSTFSGYQDAVVARLDANGSLQFSSYLGGSNYSYGYGIAVDASGYGYVTGNTGGSFPTTPGTIQMPLTGGKVFVTKYSPAGAIVYSTLVGGDSADSGNAIAVDSVGNAYVTGYSYSTSFTGAPAGGAQAADAGAGDAFVAKLNQTGTALLYFTFLGGTGFDEGFAIAVDTSGNAYIAGQTTSSGLATPGAVQTAATGLTEGFAARLNAAGSSFGYVTYLGGIRENYLTSMALDAAGDVYLAGYTNSANFPIVSALQTTIPGNGTSLFSSTDSGGTWSVADSSIPGAVFDISLNPANASAVVITEAGIYRTNNAGASWTQQLSSSFSSSSSHLGRSPAAPQTIYALNYSNIYQSTDDGLTWNYMGYPQIQGLSLTADPVDAGTLYVFGNGSPAVYKSTDGGRTWNPAAIGLPIVSVAALVATSDGALYAGTQGSGIYKSTDHGASWGGVNNGLPTAAFVSNPQSLSASGTTVYFANASIFKTTNGGASWTSTFTFVDSFQIATSPQNSSILYAYTNNSVVESGDAGTSFDVAGIGLPSAINPFSAKLIVDPRNIAHLFVVAPVNRAAFVSKLNNAGSALIWSTYLGGSGSAGASGIAQNGKGSVFVTGFAEGQNFPITSSLQPPGPDGSNAFITEISDTAPSCSITVNPANATTAQNVETLNFNIVAPSGCSWTASTNESWAVVTSGASGTGVGTITVQLGLNSDTTSTARTAVLTVNTQNITITQAGGQCSYVLDKNTWSAPSAGGATTVVVTTTAGCPWVITNASPNTISITSEMSGIGSATISLTVTPNSTANQQYLALMVGNTGLQIIQAGATPTPALQFVTLAPCRIIDTRNPNGPLGGPFLSARTTRSVPVPNSSCGIPSDAAAYALNVTVVPRTGTLGYLTVWPAGLPQPLVSTLNSLDGSILANAAIVPAGTDGSIDVFATDDTELIVDINGYFTSPASNTLQFYPLTPCRVLDTRHTNGDFGGPAITGGSTRSLLIPSSSCAVPAGAADYSLNVTVVPHGTLRYLTAWPTGQTQPVVSTLNSLDGTVLANAAIIPAGTGGAVSFYATDTSDLIVDINGYFAPPATGGLNFYPATPCRLLDTRNPDGTFGGPVMSGQSTRSFPLAGAACGLPDTAQAYSLNMTAGPQAAILGYLSAWPAGAAQPVVSTLNALKGQVVANAAIVAAGAGGAIDLFVTDTTHVIVDTNGYFAR
jgi:photosystem II stability/assembly factor-like uncharacterized protein